MRAKKALGQHFLRSAKALQTIIDTAELKEGETILEIGPGEGALTEKLLNAGCAVTAVEKDKELYEFLKQKFVTELSSGQLTLTHDDILNFDSAGLEKTYKLVANIPYNITGAILKKFLSTEHQPSLMVLLLQKEVARRICGHSVSTGGSARKKAKESVLSISVQVYGQPRYVEMVKAGAFVPRPRIDSAIIIIDNISKDFFKQVSEKQFFNLVRAGFNAKRKKLLSNLSNAVPREKVLEAFSQLGLPENTRAEDVDIGLWRQISDIIYA